MPSRNHQTASQAEHLSVIGCLSVLPFPEQEQPQGKEKTWSGPGYHLAVLRESQDFWEDRSEEIVATAEQEIDDSLAVLVAALTDRWGEPEAVDLWTYLGCDKSDSDFLAPEPLNFLAGVTGCMQVWRLPSSSRWLGLAVGQADPEWPIQLLAAVGENAALPDDEPTCDRADLSITTL
ncbi:hypothetical protein [Streptomyces sp. NPDC001635]